MSVENRRSDILRILKNSDSPVSGSYLSDALGVSRQIIVQDMNRLKADGHDVISTARGYILIPPKELTQIFKVKHSVEDTRKELYLIVDLGASIKDVFIYHRVYGEIHGPLNISSRRDADLFCNDIESGKSSPLSTATSGYHYHTISAKDKETLDLVEQALKEAGFLAELTDYEPSVLISQFED